MKRLMTMTEGEQLIWAATYSHALAGGSRPPLAIRLATSGACPRKP